MKLATKIIIAGIVILLMAIVISIVYRLFFEFNNSAIKAYIKQEASKYSNSDSVIKILTDGVFHILEDRELTNQVKVYAQVNQISVEQALVTAVVAEAKEMGYLLNS